MIDIEQARQILDLAGGSIRYWAKDVVDQRAKTSDRANGIMAGDLVSLSFSDPSKMHRYTVVPEQFLDQMLDSDSIDDPDYCDQLVQIVAFGEVRYSEVAMTSDEARSLQASLKKMRVEDE